METSAKTGFNAQELFVEAGKILFEEMENLQIQHKESKDKFGIKLSEKNEGKSGSCCF